MALCSPTSPVRPRCIHFDTYHILCCISLGHYGAVVLCLFLSNKTKLMALGLENIVAWFFKKSFHLCQTKNLSACVAPEPGSGLAWVVGERCALGRSSPRHQLSSLDSGTEMNGIYESRLPPPTVPVCHP